MRIDEYLNSGQTSFSFEFFPPKTEEATAALERTITELGPLQPTFVSVTYGAGGSTRRHTIELASRIKREKNVEAMAHLTCVGHSRDELRTVLRQLSEAGIENIMALRGDPPAGAEQFEPHPNGLRYGSELIGFIRDVDPGFCIGAAAYPEGHIESDDRHVDLRYLVHKQDQGVSFFVTQLFFDNAFYFDFVERARRAGVMRPIVAGVMPIENVDQIRRFTRRCGATISARLARALEGCTSAQAVRDLGVRWAIDQCRELLERGAPGIHFYTLNRSRATRGIMQALGVARVQHRRAGAAGANCR